MFDPALAVETPVLESYSELHATIRWGDTPPPSDDDFLLPAPPERLFLTRGSPFINFECEFSWKSFWLVEAQLVCLGVLSFVCASLTSWLQSEEQLAR